MTLLQPVSTWPAPHVAAAVLRDGVPLETLGDAGRVFPLASVTKLLAAYGVLIAVEEGVFALDDPCGPTGSTVRHLLAHASGVGFRREDRAREVGERRVYSSYGFELLADAVARETGIPFPEYLREAVFAPLGMDHTVLEGSAGHGARACLADLIAFAAELAAPQLVHHTTLAEAWRVQFPELRGIVPGYGMQKPCPWGLGFEIKGRKDPHWTGASLPADTVGHFGMSGTYLWHTPSEGFAMIALTDRDFGAWAKPLWTTTNEHIWAALDSRRRG